MTAKERAASAAEVTEEKSPVPFSIEPFDPDRHDRNSFSCGVDQVDNFFKKTANKLMKSGSTAVYVVLSEQVDVAEFYAMNAHAVHFEELSSKYKRLYPVMARYPQYKPPLLEKMKNFGTGKLERICL